MRLACGHGAFVVPWAINGAPGHLAEGSNPKLAMPLLLDIKNTAVQTGWISKEALMARKKAAGSSHNTHSLRVKDIRRKEIDADQMAMVFWMIAKGEVQRRREAGEPPRELTPERRAELEKAYPELAKARKRLKKAQAQLHKHGIEPQV